ncbi:MAG: sulfotransferase [Myxococcota bacterium]|nr:sulfotransferase [Myxococcota bacterium]
MQKQDPMSDPSSLIDAVHLFRQGDRLGAIRICEKIVHLQSDDVEANHLLGLLYNEQGDIEKALPHLKKVCLLTPNNAVAHVSLGSIQHQRDQLEEAAKHFRTAIRLDGHSSDAHYGLGQVLEAQGLQEEAIRQYEQTLLMSPNHAYAHHSLSLHLIHRSQFAQALPHAQQAMLLEPEKAAFLMVYASTLLSLGDSQRAQAIYQQVLSLEPNFVPAHNAIGGILQEDGNYKEALTYYARSGEIDPSQSEAFAQTGFCLLKLNQYSAALKAFFQSLENDPLQPKIHAQLSNLYCEPERYRRARRDLEDTIQRHPKLYAAYFNLGNLLQSGVPPEKEKAMDMFKKCLQLYDSFPSAHNNLANLQMAMNQKQEALLSYRKAVHYKPDFAEAYFQIAMHSTYSSRTEEVKQMERLYRSPALPEEKKLYLAFGLGKIYQQLGLIEESFQYYQVANRLKRKQFSYSVEDDRLYFQQIKEVFQKSFFSSFNALPPQGNSPIFIVGMMRSGTTLTEQIISSHPDVFGAGECTTLKTTIKAFGLERRYPPFPETILHCSTEERIVLAQKYQAVQQSYAPESPYISNKLPHNFLFIGLIHTLFPHAKIIHCNRKAIDNCWSNYRMNFTNPHPYAYDLRELGMYHRLYQDLMQHWRHTIPDAFYDLSYERLVHDPKGEIRKLLAYCELSWDDRCLRFYDQKRFVETPSLFQVRTPIYRSSIDAWLPYKKNLKPLIETLGSELPSP